MFISKPGPITAYINNHVYSVGVVVSQTIYTVGLISCFATIICVFNFFRRRAEFDLLDADTGSMLSEDELGTLVVECIQKLLQ